MSIALTTPCGTPPSCCGGGGPGWWPEGCCPTTGATDDTCAACEPCTPASMTVVIDQGAFQGTHVLPYYSCNVGAGNTIEWRKTASGRAWRLFHGSAVSCAPNPYNCGQWSMTLYQYPVPPHSCSSGINPGSGCHPATPFNIGAYCSGCPGATLTIVDAGAGLSPCNGGGPGPICPSGYAANTLLLTWTNLCGSSGSMYLYFGPCYFPSAVWFNGSSFLSYNYVGPYMRYWTVYLAGTGAYGVYITNCNGSRVCNEAFELLVDLDGNPITPTCPPPCGTPPTSIMVTPDPCGVDAPGMGACAAVNNPPLCVLCDGQKEANCFTFRRNADMPATTTVGQCFKINTTPGLTPDFSDQCNSWEQNNCNDEPCNTGFPYFHNCSYFYAHSFVLYDNLSFQNYSLPGCLSACHFRTSSPFVVGKVYGGLTTGCGMYDARPTYTYNLYAAWELVAPSAYDDLMFGVMTFFIFFPTGGGPYGASSFWKIIGQAWSNDESYPCGKCQSCNQTWPVCRVLGQTTRMCNFVTNEGPVGQIGAFFPCCE